ncbi:MAG: hypothetical protein RL754_1274 [Bacteroidota bacterium]|jgi:carboxyl-terminal processing protease
MTLQDIMQRKNIKYLIPIVGIAAVLLSFRYFGPQEDKEAVIFSLIRDALTNVHLQPREMDDALSMEVFNSYLEALDYNKLFLTQGEVDQLSTYETLLDDAFKATNTAFFEMSYGMIIAGIDRSKGIYTKLLASPMDFDKDETVWNTPEREGFARDEAALVDQWRKHLKWRLINRIYEKDRAQQEDAETDPTVELKDFATLEKEAREKELELQNDWYDDLKDLTRTEWFGIYMNAYCETYDPHTSYLAPRQNENFEVSMTGQFEGIGAALKKEGDYITIDRIIAGSACWRQGDLEAGDKILAVAQGAEEPVDVVGWKVHEAIDLIRGEKGSEVRLTVKKKDGSRQIIPIIRDVVELESTFARSAVLDGSLYRDKDGAWSEQWDIDEKVGYIRLPKFYVNFYKESNRNAAEDVKNEILKLKEEGVEGIILDLRGNGGGSLAAATEIAGLFTERGPQVQVKSFQNGTRSKSNKDAKVYWDGPLVVLVNHGSASASEIVSAALQDRKRALIVGAATSTFGKGTVQNMFELDRAVSGPLNELKPLGAVKITTEKFYRINGGTTQLQGVVPDVILPGPYDKIAYGEKEYPNALPVDYIDRATYNEDASWVHNFSTAIANSKKRVSGNDNFGLYEDYANWIAQSEKDTQIPLNYAKYTALQDDIKENTKRFKEIGRMTDSLGIQALPHHLNLFETDSAQADIYQKWFKGLSKDLILSESVQIMMDL